MSPRRLLVAAAGSGGHVYPGLAVARAFADLGEAEIRFVGTATGIENRLVPAHGFGLERVPVPTLRGRSLPTLPRAGWGVARSLAGMRRLLREFRPGAVFGTGGHVSGTAVLAAFWARVPSLILEPNAEPGLATRWSAPFATELAFGLAPAARRRSRRAFVSGVPVRAAFSRLAPPPVTANRPVSLLVTGGSQGASRLNRLVVAALPVLRKRAPRLGITHQTGAAEEAEVRAAYAAHGVPARVVAWLDDRPAAVGAADLVVGRAGAITCAELAAAGRPGILVPAGVAGGHQRQNAAAVAAAGAAVALEETVSGERFARTVAGLVGDPGRRARMSRAALSLAGERPAVRLAERLVALAGGAA